MKLDPSRYPIIARFLATDHARYPTLAALHVLAEKKPPSDDDLKKAMEWMQANGLAPTGTGKPTQPSQIPSFRVIWDPEESVYFLLTDYQNGSGDLWSIAPNGDSEFLSGVKTGEFKPSAGQVVYDDSDFRDHVELEVIQEIYGLLDPNFDRPEDYDGAPGNA